MGFEIQQIPSSLDGLPSKVNTNKCNWTIVQNYVTLRETRSHLFAAASYCDILIVVFPITLLEFGLNLFARNSCLNESFGRMFWCKKNM